MNIEGNQELFLKEMSQLKSDLISSLSSENVEKYREKYKGRYSPERFKEYFIEKVAIHIIFKYVLVRMIEEKMGRVKVKLSESGIRNWQEMSKNYREDYILLLDFAEKDVKREKELGEIFKEVVYEDRSLVTKTKNVVMSKYIPKLAKYDFETISENTTLTLVEVLYTAEKREELQKFHQDSAIINFLLRQVGLA